MWEIKTLSNVTFQSGINTLTLRAPELSNSAVFNESVNRVRLKSGILKVQRDPIWPKFTTHTYNFTLACGQNPQDILDFLSVSLGLNVTLIDHESRTWSGIITNPGTTIVAERRNMSRFEIIYEGELVAW